MVERQEAKLNTGKIAFFFKSLMFFILVVERQERQQADLDLLKKCLVPPGLLQPERFSIFPKALEQWHDAEFQDFFGDGKLDFILSILTLLSGQWGFWNTPSFLAGHMQDSICRTGGEIVQMVEDVKYIVSSNKKTLKIYIFNFRKTRPKKESIKLMQTQQELPKTSIS